VVRERRRHGTWGPKKLQAVLVARYAVAAVPAASTIGNILKRHGLTRQTRGRRPVSQPDRRTRTEATRPNAVWAADFQGWFRTRDGQRCDPLTISDLFSRYVVACRIVAGPRSDRVRPAFRQVFRRYGLPEVLRVDNGSPFGSRGVCGLSRLSAWWLQLGIRVEFIEPGHPEQNGVHERMHRTLQEETARPPAATPPAQQARFDRWRHAFNRERPHEAIGMQRPAQRYRRSARRYTDHPAPPQYPLHYEVRRVKRQGMIKWRNQWRYICLPIFPVAHGALESLSKLVISVLRGTHQAQSTAQSWKLVVLRHADPDFHLPGLQPSYGGVDKGDRLLELAADLKNLPGREIADYVAMNDTVPFLVQRLEPPEKSLIDNTLVERPSVDLPLRDNAIRGRLKDELGRNLRRPGPELVLQN
jgi:transposase InsO family protein